MATIHAADDGTLLRVLHTAELERRFPDPPEGAARSLTFDPASNAALVADLARSTDPYRLTGAGLTRDGQAVAINPPGEAMQDRDALLTLVDGLQAGSGTAGERLRRLEVTALLILRHLRRNGL